MVLKASSNVKPRELYMRTDMQVLVLGHGEMGHAMEFLLKDRCQLAIWDRQATEDFEPVDLESACRVADLVIICLPVNPHHQILQSIKHWLKADSI